MLSFDGVRMWCIECKMELLIVFSVSRYGCYSTFLFLFTSKCWCQAGIHLHTSCWSDCSVSILTLLISIQETPTCILEHCSKWDLNDEIKMEKFLLCVFKTTFNLKMTCCSKIIREVQLCYTAPTQTVQLCWRHVHKHYSCVDATFTNSAVVLTALTQTVQLCWRHLNSTVVLAALIQTVQLFWRHLFICIVPNASECATLKLYYFFSLIGN